MDQMLNASMNTSCYPYFPYPYCCPTSKDDDDDDDTKKSPWCYPWMCPPFNSDPYCWPCGPCGYGSSYGSPYGSPYGSYFNWPCNPCGPSETSLKKKIEILTKLIGPDTYLKHVVQIADADRTTFYANFNKHERNFLNLLKPHAVNYIYKELFAKRKDDQSAWDITYNFSRLLDYCGNDANTKVYCPLAHILTRGHAHANNGASLAVTSKIKNAINSGQDLANWLHAAPAVVVSHALNKGYLNYNLFRFITRNGVNALINLLRNINTGLQHVHDAGIAANATQLNDTGDTEKVRTNLEIFDKSRPATIKNFFDQTDVNLGAPAGAYAQPANADAHAVFLNRALKYLRYVALEIPHLLRSDDVGALKQKTGTEAGQKLHNLVTTYYPSGGNRSYQYERTYNIPQYQSYRPSYSAPSNTNTSYYSGNRNRYYYQ